MASYSVQDEAAQVLRHHLLEDSKLDLPKSILEAAERVKFVGDDTQPFIPTPCKITESSSALNALVGAAASAVAKERYGLDYQDVEVNTDVATLFLMSILLPTIKGVSALKDERIRRELAKGDVNSMEKPIHRFSTNVYRTKDGRWFHLHGSMNAAPTMSMMRVPEQDVTQDEAIKIFADKVAQWDSVTIEKTANEQYRQAGVTVNTPEEFFSSEQGRIMKEEPLYSLKPLPAPKKAWPPARKGHRPLEGIRVIDFTRVIAGPVISKLLALLGADVLKITSSKLPDVSVTWLDLSTGKADCNLDLKSEEGRTTFKQLLQSADVLIDGYRPGTLERLGISSTSLRETNPSLVYLRENCYGFKGPLSYRSGWQQISDCLVGISWLQGKFLGLDEPVVPLLPNSDYQMGLAGAIAVIHALLLRSKDDVTFDIDISLTQYNIWYYNLGQYTEQQQKELLARNEGFHVRHYDDMAALVAKTHAAIQRSRPGIFKPSYFQPMSGKDWGVDEDIHILVPPFKLSKSTIGYSRPSGSRGRSRPEWLEPRSNL